MRFSEMAPGDVLVKSTMELDIYVLVWVEGSDLLWLNLDQGNTTRTRFDPKNDVVGWEYTVMRAGE